MTSAVRIGGERLYKKARRGEEVDRPEREVEVHRADLLESGDGSATFEIECSSGTYVRTLVERSGTPTASRCAALASGPLVPATARPSEIRRPTNSWTSCPTVELDAEAERLVRNGIRIEGPEDAPPSARRARQAVGLDGSPSIAGHRRAACTEVACSRSTHAT